MNTIKTRPCVEWNHVNGAYLMTTSRNIVWLSFIDKLLLRLGLTNASKLDRKYSKLGH